MNMKLKSLTISGFKSFNSDEHTVKFGDVTVLIGANGAGKSNFVSFFKMIGDIKIGNFQQYIAIQGGANSFLNFGSKVTQNISAKFEFENKSGYDVYEFNLGHAAQDSLILEYENLSYQETREFSFLTVNESEYSESMEVIYYILRNSKVYQFHDTSSTAKIRNSGYINQNEFLYEDGGNLAAFLYGLKENRENRPYYDKIVRHIKRTFPQFGDFDLQPRVLNNNYIMLDWHEQNNPNYKLGAHQLSDGTLRFMALTTLLLQPPKNLPSIIILDEPELGLHPSAIVELASMVKIASQHSQVILATQSPALLDEFNIDQITVIERDPVSKSSVFKQFSEEEMKYWLEDYTLSEIWDKNILGGKP
jgi:predicted ATPase